MIKIKNILRIAFVLLIFSGCKHTYKASSSGLDYESSVQIVRANDSESMNDLILMIDDKRFVVEKVYREKKILKAPKFYTSPGKHIILIKKGITVVHSDTVFLGNQETRKIILR